MAALRWHDSQNRDTLETKVHIPDGFLSTPVWAALDMAGAPAVAVIARRAQRTFDEGKVPLLGVMGAFVFAAQMINFPVGPGTSGHLVGGALLAYTLGPAAASVVLTAIVAIQALVFQDGGILALGANVLNMAVLGVLAGYLPYHFWGRTRARRAAIFAGGALSVLISAVMALSELLLSGVRMPGGVLGISVGLFAVSALAEGAITLAVIGALERIQPEFIRQPAAGRSYALGAVAIAAVLLVTGGVLLTSTSPDGIEKLGQARTLLSTPFSGYGIAGLGSGWLPKAGAGLLGLGLVYGVCLMIGRRR
ncbi:MAG TPA: energy-coupling factor ABC transporter permease [Verrucomicrobiae bacterium]|nr:energy-coupling factor ABC transporter permease [Verrucomicrobiae bacterium]